MPPRARARTTRLAQRTILKFLNAAEEVFGRHGYEGTTIRAIAGRARVNLGTLQHYWGSKRELFRDLFERRFRPLQREHLRRLRAIEARAADGSRPQMREVLATLVETTFLIGADPAEAPDLPRGTRERKRFHALFGRALMDPSPVVVAELNRLFDEPFRLFLELMRRARPDLSVAELDWRVNCILGAQVFSQVYRERVGRFFGAEAEVDDELAAAWVLHFLMGGIGAAPAG